ncbi:MAG: mechanosensitive ion channel family protein [Gammaproteobacteria bacterium]|nr:mechanosensitive ion channel family protein [Gammaproteobacteria bacterium]
MGDLTIARQDILQHLHPDTFVGAVVYLLLTVLLALLLSRLLRVTVRGALVRRAHVDRTTMMFLQQMGIAAIWVIMLILYAHLIPVLRSLGTALLTGASIASVVIGLAAQSTLGNLVAGVAITLYRPFRLGDRLQVAAPTGTEVGSVDALSLGYTTLRTDDGRFVVLPNSVAASQVVINLSASQSHVAPLAVSIHVSRAAGVAAARELALRTAREAVSEATVIGCFVTRMDGGGATLELRLRTPATADRDALRSKLLEQLAQHFAAAGVDGKDGQQASFS